jgi:hypothetical protein
MICLAALGLVPSVIFAQEAETQDLAKEAQNPLANVISMPFQNNTDFGIGEYDQTGNALNIQPILPAMLGDKGWIMINRIIAPLPKTYPDLSSNGEKTVSGIGDISYTAWFAPPVKGKLTWGFGATTILPTASNEYLGQRKFSVGPSVVLVYSEQKYMLASVLSNWKSVAGDESSPDVNTFYFQYIFTYFMQNKWYTTTAPINLANWEAEEGQKWTVPVGGGFGKMFQAGNLPMDLSAHAYYNVVKPEMGSDWQLRVQLKLIFPKGK